jgi:uncharacterized protein
MMLLDLSWWELALAILVVIVGTIIQSAVGFGLALIAAPVLLLIDRNLVPGPLIAAALFQVIWMAYKNRHAIDFSHFKAALLGRMIGTPPAALLMGTISVIAFDLIFAAMVLIAVAISLVHTSIKATPRNIFLATALSGFMSTISSIGGPPVALVYQNTSGPELRGNLAMLFTMGCVISLTALTIIGRFHVQDLFYSLFLIVGVIVGVLCSGPFKRLIDKQSARPWLLGLCSLSALLVLARALLALF